jgi:ribosomal protein L21E
MNRLGKASHSNIGGTMKRTDHRSLILFLLFLITFLALTLVASAQGEAQRQVFKKGDRVLASPYSMKDEKYWRRCTVTEVHNFVPKRAYAVECEPESAGGSPSSFLVKEDWVKAAPAHAAANPNNEVAENNQPAGNQPTAQNQQMQFKVGDRVEIDVIMAGNPQNSIYKKGTVTEVDEAGKSYVVAVDPLPGKLPQSYRILVRDYGKHWIRPIQGADTAPKILVEKLRTDENGTVLADRPLLDCENLNRKGRNGAPPPVELAKKMIRCLIEKPSEPGADGARTMDITGITMGAPHRWRVYVDIGQGNANTLVYPFHAKFNQKTFYRTRNVLVTDREDNFTCFVDATNLWQCGYASGVKKEGKTQEIMVQK